MTYLRFAALIAGAGLFAAASVAAPTVSGAWIRALPGDTPAGGYFTLTNPAKTKIALTGAASPACGAIELHMTHKMGTMVHMMPVARVEVAAGGTFAFAPGGFHLMCLQPKGLTPGTSVAVTLTFADGTHLTAPFAVKNATGQ
jgi:copper(I)-binding protein